MNKNIFIIIANFLIISSQFLTAETLLSENFTSNIMPPPGWSIDNHSSSWSISHYNESGGTSPEGYLNNSVEWTDTSRFISPAINSAGSSVLNLQFKHSLRRYTNSFTIGAATRSNGGPWHIVWLKSVFADIPSETVLIQISNEDIGSTTFQFCLFFGGNTKDLGGWYLDDFVLATAMTHDVGVQGINNGYSASASDPFIPIASIRNFGGTVETFTVVCKIYDYYNNLLTESTSTVTNLGLIEVRNVSLTPFVLPTADYLYKVEFYTQLPGDLNSTNDTLSKLFNTYTTNKKAVTVEIGTDIGCGYCPGAQLGGEDLINNGKKVGVIEYHGWGGIYSNPEAVSRFLFYGILGIPQTYFDGVLKYYDGDPVISMYSNYLPLYDSMYSKKTPLDINITGKSTDDTTYALTVSLKKFGLFVSNNPKLFVALTESHIPCSWEGLTELNNCERRLLPDANGYTVDLISQSTVSVPFTLSLKSSWVKTNCNLITFVQDINTKEIFNTQVVKLTDITDVNETLPKMPTKYILNQNYPNPFNPSTTISYSVPISGLVSIKIYNIAGQEITPLINEVKGPGNYQVNLNTSKLSSGIYFYKMVSKNFTDIKKMCVIK